MYLFRLIFKNAWRHKLRTGLTVVGVVVAIMAFGLLRTVIDAWYSGANATSSARLVTRNAISLTFFLPMNYAEKIRHTTGVSGVSWSDWFGGVYQTEKNFFPQFAIEANSYLDLYPEFRLPPDQKRAFLLDRKGCIVGNKLAQQYGWKIGDQIPLRGTIFGGTWSFTLDGIYSGADRATDERLFFFHWAYLNETIKQQSPGRGDSVGVYVVGLRDPASASAVSAAIDDLFKNSLAETLTETEKAFQLGFVAMSEQILLALQAVSLVIIVIIMAVMSNTMTMAARERIPEYATLKAIGFSDIYVAALIAGESLAIALIGGGVGVAVTFPVIKGFAAAVGPIFPSFLVSRETVFLQLLAAVLVGTVAALWPAWRSTRIRIIDGLRAVA